MRWIALVTFGVVGLAALAFGLRWGARRQRLIFSGEVAQGKVVAPGAVAPASGAEGAPPEAATSPVAPRPAPLVEFRTARGETVRIEGRAGSGEAPLLEAGASVPIVYDPERPAEAVIGERSEAWVGPLVISLAGLLFLALGLGGFFFIAGSDRDLQAAGKQAELDQLVFRQDAIRLTATIDRVQRLEGVRPEKFVLVCRGVRPGGRVEEEFRSDTFPFAPDESFAGRTVEVILDPADPRAYLVELGPLLKEILRLRR